MNITAGTKVAFAHDIFSPVGTVVSVDERGLATLDVMQAGQPLKLYVAVLREHRHGRGCGC